jgi:hypothetical protein
LTRTAGFEAAVDTPGLGLLTVEVCDETKGVCPKTMDPQNNAVAIMHIRNFIDPLN